MMTITADLDLRESFRIVHQLTSLYGVFRAAKQFELGPASCLTSGSSELNLFLPSPHNSSTHFAS